MGPMLTHAEGFVLGVGAKMFSCCGARYVSATGGAPIAPHSRGGERLQRGGKCDLWGCLSDYNFILTQKA